MEFDSRCCRCWRTIPSGKEIGGSYGGVVCTNHRSCNQCWFRSKQWGYGRRKREPAKTKKIALVNKPRQHSNLECYGCYYEVPFHRSAEGKLHAAEMINTEYEAMGFITIDSE